MPNKPFETRSRRETELLLNIHRMEEARVAGPGSSGKDIRDVLWTISQAMEEVGPEFTLDQINSLIRHMAEKNEIMVIPGSVEGDDGHITRTAETIRLLGHTYEYWHQGRPGADAVRWLPVRKPIPDRNIGCTELIARLDSDLSEFTPEYSGSDLEAAVHEVVLGLSQRLGKGDPDKASYSEFQYRATRDTLLSSIGGDGKTQVLTAGVGSGKTIGFLLPSLILARYDELMNQRGATIVLYPRTALAKDQFKSLGKYSDSAGLTNGAVHSEMSDYYKKHFASVSQGVRRVHGHGGGPLVIVSTMETLKRRLQNPDFVRGVLPRLRRVIIDEVHLVNGMQGAHVATLMRRLRRLSGQELLWTASSATIASPEDHVSRLFEVDSKSVDVVAPKDEELVTDGIQNHVFVRPSGRISNLGLLVNMTSIVLHSRRDDLSDKPTTTFQIENASKAIGFADNLDMLGRWNSDLMENERTEHRAPERNDGVDRPHPTKEKPIKGSWSRQQREIPYAARFQNPLNRRIACRGGILDTEENRGETAMLPVLENHPRREEDLCGMCKEGKRIDLGKADEETMRRMSQLVHRIEHHEKDKYKPFLIDSQIFKEAQDPIGTLDLCPYLRSGACTWFSRSDPGATSIIEGSEADARYEYSAVGRSAIFSSKSERSSDEDGLSSMVFRDTLENVYGLEGRKKQVSVDMVLASPSLEVGIDLPNLTDSVMVNAIRNIASYRQKAGRVGREPFIDALNTTLVTDSTHDLHYYRQPSKLVHEGRLEPVPLKERNHSVVLCGIYQSVWDWLAMHSSLPEVVPRDWVDITHGHSRFRANLEKCDEDLESRGPEVSAHLSSVCSGMFAPGSPQVQDAIGQVQDEIRAFLRPASGTRVFTPSIEGHYKFADVIARILSHGDTPETPVACKPEVRALLKTEGGDWANLSLQRRSLAPLERRGRVDKEALEELDKLIRWGVPDLNKLREIGRRLRANLEAMPEGGASWRKLNRFMDNTFDPLEENLELLEEDGWDPLGHELIKQYEEMAQGGEWRKTYFSTIRQDLDCLRMLQREVWFVEPTAFFRNPYDAQVELGGREIGESQRLIPVSEALHSYVPGSHSYRMPQGCYKVLARGMTASPGSAVSYVHRDRLEGKGNTYKLTRDSVPGPPGLPEGTNLSVYTPVKLWLRRERRKYILLNPAEGLLMDRDDMLSQTSSGRDTKIKVPRSFNNRWTHVEDPEGERVGLRDPSDSQLGRLGVKTGGETLHGSRAAELLTHPLIDKHITAVRWHDKLKVTEYVYSTSRTYSTDSGYGAEIRFRDEFGNISWGEAYDTEGISFDLSPESVERTVSRILGEAADEVPVWTPTILKAFSSYLTQLPVEEESSDTFNHFDVQDLTAYIIASAGDGDASLNQSSLIEVTMGLCDDEERLREIVRRRILAASGNDPENIPEGEDEHQHDSDTEEKITTRILLVRELVTALTGRTEEFADEFLPKWIHRSILMGLGISATTALQRIAGSQNSDIGYAIDPDSWEGGRCSFHIYDRSHFGNGNCRVAKKHLYIPHFLRHRINSRSKLLPSSDFLTTLEEVLLQCMQHQSDMVALSLHESDGQETDLSAALQDIFPHAKETRGVAGGTWSRIGIDGIEDGWKTPLKFHIRKELAMDIGEHPDDVTRGTKFCWNGCPECIERIDMVLGGIHGMPYLDKAVLDTWFKEGRASSPEYHDLPLESIADGSSGLQLGVLHNVTLEVEGRLLRSSLLPWTIGLHIDRSDPSEGAGLVIRESDVLGHRLTEMSGQQVIVGTPSVGIKRLLWFDLVITAYLDAAGKLYPPDIDLEANCPCGLGGRHIDCCYRRIDLVYYDVRDLDFEDSGLTPRMLESVLSLAKSHGFHRFEKLSDVLAWLVHRGFNMRICVDSGRAEEEGVRDFLVRLRDRTEDAEGSLKILTKSINRASMHKKILLTPVWGLTGSANLTASGTALSEEIEAHILASNPNYIQLRTSCEDSMHGAREW